MTRVPEILESYKPPQGPPRKTALKPLATAISKRAIMKAHATNMRSILMTATETYYEKTSYGVLWNVEADGKIDPVPWGSKGYKAWGVKRMYSTALRTHLMDQQEKPDCLYLWDDTTRCWYINLSVYPRVSDALGWVQRQSPNAETVMELLNYLKNKGN